MTPKNTCKIRGLLRRPGNRLQSRSAPVLRRSNVEVERSLGKWDRAGRVEACCARGRAHSAVVYPAALAATALGRLVAAALIAFEAGSLASSPDISLHPFDSVNDTNRVQQWSWHAQNTDIVQYHPGFASKYSGPN